MKNRKTGRTVVTTTVGDEPVRAFIPNPLPPFPPLRISSKLQEKINTAHLATGRLNAIGALLPDTALVVYMYVRKEAVLSSQIEGTQSSLTDLLLYESDAMPGAPIDDVRESSNYVAALEHGIRRLHDGFPLSLRLIRELHGILLSKGRGSDKTPGEFRVSQNWIGGTRPDNAIFVPPPPNYIIECMGELEKFFHNQPTHTPSLIKAALAHAQFETIHPFLDGNGRIGRLLITLILCAEKILTEPLLYLSLYFKTHRDRYYELLQLVRARGDWEAWIDFFMSAVAETADQVFQTARRLIDMNNEDKTSISSLGRSAGSALRVHDILMKYPVRSINAAMKETGLSHHTVHTAFLNLGTLGIVREVSGRSRKFLFAHDRFIRILNEGTELNK